jgi:hypothetical protein
MNSFLENKVTGTFPVPEGVTRQKLLADVDDELGSGSNFVFKVGEVGRGRVDTSLGYGWEPSEGPHDANSSSQDEMDRRLMEYIADYSGGI